MNFNFQKMFNFHRITYQSVIRLLSFLKIYDYELGPDTTLQMWRYTKAFLFGRIQGDGESSSHAGSSFFSRRRSSESQNSMSASKAMKLYRSRTLQYVPETDYIISPNSRQNTALKCIISTFLGTFLCT